MRGQNKHPASVSCFLVQCMGLPSEHRTNPVRAPLSDLKPQISMKWPRSSEACLEPLVVV